MEAVYGFDQDGLDNEWRASVGLPPREGAGGGGEEPAPTFPPSNGGNGSAREDDGGGASVGLVIGLAVAILAAAGAIAFATYVLARRFR
jgi:hypothetical protein